MCQLHPCAVGPEGEMLEERHKFASKRAVDLWSSLHVLIESPHRMASRMARPSGAVTMQTKGHDTSAAQQISRQQPLRGRMLGGMPTLVSVWSQHRVVVCVGFGSLAVVARLRAVGCSKRAGRAWSSNLVVPTEALRPPFQMQPRMQA